MSRMRQTDQEAEAPPAFNLRLPLLLKQELREEAQKHQRSLNSEIVYRLFRSLNEYKR